MLKKRLISDLTSVLNQKFLSIFPAIQAVQAEP
jgi:hypothetical protein